MLVSACGRSRWRATGWAALIYILMFVTNVIGQLWDGATFARPFSLFYFYQPQKIWLSHDWSVNLGEAWPGLNRHTTELTWFFSARSKRVYRPVS